MKKITYEEAAYIRRYKKQHLGEKYFFNWYIQKENNVSGYMRLYEKWWFYLLTFIPIHIIKIFWYMWDGGLKEFECDSRLANHNYVLGFANDDSTTEFGRFNEVWKKYESN